MNSEVLFFSCLLIRNPKIHSQINVNPAKCWNVRQTTKQVQNFKVLPLCQRSTATFPEPTCTVVASLKTCASSSNDDSRDGKYFMHISGCLPRALNYAIHTETINILIFIRPYSFTNIYYHLLSSIRISLHFDDLLIANVGKWKRIKVDDGKCGLMNTDEGRWGQM